MRFASVLGTAEDGVEAIDDVVEQLREALPEVHLVVLFASPDHARTPGLAKALSEAFPGALVAGCQAGGVLASGVELEGTTGLAVLGAFLPNVGLHPFHLDRALISGPDDLALAVQQAVGEHVMQGMLVLSDPYTFDLGVLVPALSAALPGVPLFGGQASGSDAPGPHALFLRGRSLPGGALCVGLSGEVHIETLVAQGCRPVGPPMFITACEGNLLLELDGKSPVEVLKQIYDDLSPSDQEHFRHGQFLGIQMQEQTEYQRGDFLIRHVLGVPADGRGLAIAAPLKRYDVVQLHVRDGRSSRDDLAAVLGGYQGPAPSGALLFSCLGRGRGLFGEAHHDSRSFQQAIGPVALAGFFANGELGPVQGVAHVHGYTSVFVLFSTPGA